MQPIPKRMPAAAILPLDIRPTSSPKIAIHIDSSRYAGPHVGSSLRRVGNIFRGPVLRYRTLLTLPSNLR